MSPRNSGCAGQSSAVVHDSPKQLQLQRIRQLTATRYDSPAISGKEEVPGSSPESPACRRHAQRAILLRPDDKRTRNAAAVQPRAACDPNNVRARTLAGVHLRAKPAPRAGDGSDVTNRSVGLAEMPGTLPLGKGPRLRLRGYPTVALWTTAMPFLLASGAHGQHARLRRPARRGPQRALPSRLGARHPTCVQARAAFLPLV